MVVKAVQFVEVDVCWFAEQFFEVVLDDEAATAVCSGDTQESRGDGMFGRDADCIEYVLEVCEDI